METSSKIDSLGERLQSHAESFNGLLSLIPAKVYYGEDTSDQWQRKKQTKEQKKAAKRAKLDPENAKSAKDVLDEQAACARKRKREEEEQSSPELEGIDTEKPLSSCVNEPNNAKKRKREKVSNIGQSEGTEVQPASVVDKAAELKDEDHLRAIKAAKTREKKDKKRAKAEKKVAKAEAKKARKQQEIGLEGDVKAAEAESHHQTIHDEKSEIEPEIEIDHEQEDAEILSKDGESELKVMDHGFTEGDLIAVPSPSTSPAPTNHSSTFDHSNLPSGSSSISSIVPPLTTQPEGLNVDIEDISKQGPDPAYPQDSIAVDNKARLQARIEQLRAARKADAMNGGPARSRQELLESRRRKEEERKAHKKELRRKAKEEEKRKHEETLARGSPLLSGSPLHSPASPSTVQTENNFSFGRISFPNGQRVSDSLNAILDTKSKSKGPSDPQTALLAAQKREARLASLDPAKQADITEKDIWLNAKKRAHGERIRDDTSLLKKTLKRKDKQKQKSEKEWKERIEGVQKGQAMKQKKRESNIQKRKDEKGQKKGGKGNSGGKKKARPGFEGSFRAKAPKAAGEDKPRRR